jgi:hypothetical protein
MGCTLPIERVNSGAVLAATGFEAQDATAMALWAKVDPRAEGEALSNPIGLPALGHALGQAGRCALDKSF